jgi:transcriptional regulator with XRE-family HTH domain
MKQVTSTIKKSTEKQTRKSGPQVQARSKYLTGINNSLSPVKVPLKEPEYVRRMKDYRHTHDISQPELARRMGIRQQLLSNIETTRTKLSLDFVKKFKEITGVDLLSDTTSRPFVNSREDTQKSHDHDVEVLQKEIESQRELITSLKKQVELFERILNKA